MASPVGISFLDHFAALRDPRQGWKVVYPLPEMLLVVRCGTIRLRSQRAPAAPATQTAFARPLPLGLFRRVRLLPLRWRHAGIARRLGRAGQFVGPGVQIGDQSLRLVQSHH